MAASTTCPRPVRCAVDDGGQHAVGQQHAAAAEVAHQIEGRDGALAGPADGVESAGQGDVVDIVTGPRSHGAVLTPPGHPAEHQFRVSLEAGGRTDSQPFGHTGTKALHQSLGLLDQTQDQFDPCRVLEIDGHRATSAVHEVDVGLGQRRVGGLLVAVDAHDVGAGVGQHHAGEGSRAQPGQLDDPDALEGPAHRSAARGGPGPVPTRRRMVLMRDGHGRMVASAGGRGQMRPIRTKTVNPEAGPWL